MPLVSAAIGWMLTIAVSRARRRMKSTVAELSITGLVSGWQMMVVMPPAAAAWLAEAKVSRWLAPGSPTKARMSISPGATTLPAQLTMSVPSGTPAAPMPRLESRITPSAISTSPVMSRSREGSIRRALASRIGRRSVSIDANPAVIRGALGREPDQRSGVRLDSGFGRPPGMTMERRYAFGRLRASASSTAIRTATPISTCSRISDCAPSATMESISTPRFIGPGCITSASGFA